jgi:tRNA threonylcarbamoyladenosine biosynthesis protein TsaB
VKLLAIEAGGPVLSAALFDKGIPLGQDWIRAPQRQTERLAPMVEALLRRNGVAPAGLGALACGRGPGSFTGLRSSLAFGLGWRLAVPGLRLVAVSTLEAWAEAYAAPGTGEALVLLDARRFQVYRALLARRGAAWVHQVPPGLLDLAKAQAGATAQVPRISDLPTIPGRAPATGEPDSAALALAVGRLALAALESGAEPPPWEPDYLRRSEAELLWERLHPAPAGPASGAS